MKIRKLKDDRYQVTKDGASLALSYEEWEEGFERIVDAEMEKLRQKGSGFTDEELQRMVNASERWPEKFTCTIVDY